MVKDIIKDTIFLQMKSCDATIDDLSIGTDLIDTLLFNKRTCVGLAANMIGYNKKILVYLDKNNMPNIMYNPEIIMSEKAYKTEEGCLSLIGIRSCIRHEVITVKFYDSKFNLKTKTFRGFIAEIIEHEMDHFNGILI